MSSPSEFVVLRVMVGVRSDKVRDKGPSLKLSVISPSLRDLEWDPWFPSEWLSEKVTERESV